MAKDIEMNETERDIRRKELAEMVGKVSDSELAYFLVGHIENPCEDGNGSNCRSTYLVTAQRLLAEEKISNPHIKEYLQSVIKEYSY